MHRWLAGLFIVVSSLAYAERGSFGVEVSVSTKGALPPKLKTVTIAKVTPNSAADNAGIEVGDQVLAINGCEIPGCSAFKARKEMKKEVGESVTLKIQSATGNVKDITLTAQ